MIFIQLTELFGEPIYERIDAPATSDQKAALTALSPDQVTADELAAAAEMNAAREAAQ